MRIWIPLAAIKDEEAELRRRNSPDQRQLFSSETKITLEAQVSRDMTGQARRETS
jgi:hypothetical protein